MDTAMKARPVLAWKACDAPPPDGSYVLVARKSGYIGSEWELCTCKYDPEFRPRQPWLTVSGDSITESGELPRFWTEIEGLVATMLSDMEQIERASDTPPQVNLSW